MLLLLFIGKAAQPQGGGEEVDLELVLAVDVSASVDDFEANLQRSGYIEALVAPEVVAEIKKGHLGRIAVIYIEYAGASYQRVVVDWQVIDSPESARAFVGALAGKPIGRAPATSISAAIDFAVQEIERNNLRAPRAVIDISGDGPNSDGRPVQAARDEAILHGVVINGLPILSSRPSPEGFGPSIGVTRHYRRSVIGGPGSFLLEVNEFENFAPALKQKLIREIKDVGRLTS